MSFPPNSNWWTAENYSSLLRTKTVFKESPEESNKYFHNWHRGGCLLEVAAAAPARCERCRAHCWHPAAAVWAKPRATSSSASELRLSRRQVGKKQEKNPSRPRTWLFKSPHESLSKPRPLLSSLKRESEVWKQLLLCNGSFLWKSWLRSWQPQKFLSSRRQFPIE